MRRWILYTAAVLASLVLRPSSDRDVAGLIPVELLYIYKESGNVCVETDTGDRGAGRSLTDALEDLENAAAGTIFLETADYLIVTPQTVKLLPQLQQILRPATEVCLGAPGSAEAAAYLKAHEPEVTLNDLRCGRVKLPILHGVKERYHLE